MAEKQSRKSVSTRVDSAAREMIEKVAEERRTTPAQVLRCIIEDAAKQLARDVRAA